jgi:hypothetical protein
VASGNGVQWLMELDAKLDGARAMVKELSASEKAADGADAALKKMEGHTFGGLFKEIFKAELAMEGLKKGAELAWEGVKKLGEKMWESLNIAAGEQRVAKVFDNILGKDEGKETFEYLEKFANLSEFVEGPIKKMGIELERAGLRGADFRNAMALALDVAAQAPDKMEGMGDAVASLSRISLMGKVDARTLRGLRLNPHEVADQMSADLGLSKEVIKKQLEAGALDGAKAMQSIFTVMERKTGKQLGGLGLEMASEMTSKLDKFKNIPEEMAMNLRNTQGFKDIEDSLGSFLDTVKPRLLDTNGIMGTLLDTIGARLKTIDWDTMLTKVEQIVAQMEKWAPIAETIASAALKIGQALLALPNLGERIGEFMGDADVLLKTGVIGETAEEHHQKWIDRAGEAREAALRSKEIVRGTAGGITATGGEAASAGAGLADKIDKGFRDAAEMHSPSRLFARHGEMLAEGLAQGMESGSERVYRASAAMMPSPSASGLAPGGGAGLTVGGMTFHISVDVAGGSSSSASDIAQEVQAILPNMLIGALEQVAAQAGAA